MSQPPKRRTQRDLFLHLQEEIGNQMGGQQGTRLRQSFEQELMPTMPLNPEGDKELSDEEYERRLAELKAEIPALLNFLRTCKLPSWPGA